MNVRRFKRIALLGTALCALMLGGCSSFDDPQGAGEIAGRAAQGTTPGNVTAATLMSIADKTRASGDLGSAIGFYRRAISLDPTQPKAYVALADTLNMARAPNEAIEAVRAGLAVAPNDPELLRAFGFTLLSLNQPAGAIEQFQRSLVGAKDASAYDGLGVAQDLLGDYKSADVSYRAGLALSPTDLNLRNNLGLSQALAGNYDTAIDTLHVAATDGAAGPRQRLNLALVLGLAGKTDEAAQIARIDLDERSVRSNVAYYLQLRALPPELRAQAILNPGVKAIPTPQAPANNTISALPSDGEPVASAETTTPTVEAAPTATKPAKAVSPFSPSASFSPELIEKLSSIPVQSVTSQPLPTLPAAAPTVEATAPPPKAAAVDALPSNEISTLTADTHDSAADDRPAASLADQEPAKPLASASAPIKIEGAPASAAGAPSREKASEALRDTLDGVQYLADSAELEEIEPSTDVVLAENALAATPHIWPIEEPIPVPPPAAQAAPAEMPIPVLKPTADATSAREPTPVQPSVAQAIPVQGSTSSFSSTDVLAAAADAALAYEIESSAGIENAHSTAVAEMAPADREHADVAFREEVVTEKLVGDSAPTQISSAEQGSADTEKLDLAPDSHRAGDLEPVASATDAPAAEISAAEATPELAIRSDVTGRWIQLGALRDETTAELSWDRLLRHNDDLLKSVGHAVRRTDLGPDRGIYFRLRAGPFNSIEDARNTCASLKSRKVACFVVAI
ncbi:MAG TPA: tetratricopeptide repeat protein [Alphaproteobacteria bacterium]|nr:tetratricopeptide repeat protein [Alphaproteobacteria bacterium]